MTMYDTPAARPQVAQADNLTIAAFIVAFFLPLIGLIMGVVSRRQAKRAGMRPNALATWAVWLGGVFTAAQAIVVAVLIASVGAAVNDAARAVNTPTPITAPVYASPIPVDTSPATDRPGTHYDKMFIVFKVTGSAADGADITYGSDSDNLSPDGNLGILGNGAALPWTGKIRYDKNALYYSVTAQLQGSGDIRCYVILRITRYYSDGTHLTRGKIMARGHASGEYNICDAQVNN
jgi:hypothetical protein